MGRAVILILLLISMVGCQSYEDGWQEGCTYCTIHPFFENNKCGGTK